MCANLCSLRIASAASATVAVSLLPNGTTARERHHPSRGEHKWLISSQLSRCQEKHGPRTAVKVKLADLVHHQASRHMLEDVYTKGKLIGEGGFGKVWSAKHKVLRHEVAVKTMERAPDKEKELLHEIDTLLKLDHPHIVNLIAYFKERSRIHLVFEVCRGPELYDRLAGIVEEGKNMEEWETALVLRHMLKAVRGCHSNLMGHYDIKPENFMYAGKDLDNLKMIDLGASSGFKMNHMKGKSAGTPEYMAPEFHDGIYGPAGDVFSCGIVLFVMLTGELLFPGEQDLAALSELSKNRRWLQNRLKTAQVEYGFSDEAMDLMAQMLRLDRHRRISVQQALEHPFLSKAVGHERYHDDVKGSSTEHQFNCMADFRRFSSYPIVKRAARLVLAHILPRVLARPQRLAFRSMDRDGYGELSSEAFEEWFKKKGVLVPDDLDEIVTGVNIGCSGYVNKTEFLASSLPATATKDPRYCKAVFNILDADGDEVISAKDLHEVFRSCPEDVWREALKEVCPDKKPLTWDRFSALMNLPSQSWA